MRATRDGGGAIAFHQWRKRVKTLWYALRLLEERWPRRRLLSDLERLETWLGEDHNVLTLRTHTLRHGRLPPPARGAVKALTARRQRELRRRALAVGKRVFSATSKAFIQDLRQRRKKRRDGPHRAPRRRN
jgi:hypothetical protein